MKFRFVMPGTYLYPGGLEHWAASMTGDDMIRVVQRGDELGFDYVHVPQHIVMRNDHVPVMGKRWVHTLAAMGFLAGATRRINIQGLIVVPYHNPIELAKALATIDFMSGGRLAILAAVGYMEWEYELMKSPPFAERGAVLDEYLAAMIELWTSDEPSFDGTYVQFDDFAFEPKPVRKPYPTIWIAGNSNLAVRRAARIGDGWSPNGLSRPQLAQKLEYLRSRPEWLARPRPFDVYLNLFEQMKDLTTHRVIKAPRAVMEKDAVLEQVHALAAVGVTMTDADTILGTGVRSAGALQPPSGVDEYLERMEWFAQEILPTARAL